MKPIIIFHRNNNWQLMKGYSCTKEKEGVLGGMQTRQSMAEVLHIHVCMRISTNIYTYKHIHVCVYIIQVEYKKEIHYETYNYISTT